MTRSDPLARAFVSPTTRELRVAVDTASVSFEVDPVGSDDRASTCCSHQEARALARFILAATERAAKSRKSQLREGS